MVRAPRPRLLLPLLAAALLFAGCAEVDERWTLDEKGGGEYVLALRWNADLWRRVGGVLGERVMRRLQGRDLPLRAATWREGLEGLDGVQVVELEERDTDTGMRELFVRLTFRHLRDLLGWELMARRTVKVETRPEPGAAKDEPPVCHLYMEPIAHVPVLDRIAALLAAIEDPPPPAPGAAAERDPPPLERLGIERKAAEMVWRMVKPPLEKARLSFRFTTPYRLREVRRRAVGPDATEATFAFDFADLRKPTTDRTVHLAWKMRAFDEAPRVDHTGDRDPRLPHRTPQGHNGTR